MKRRFAILTSLVIFTGFCCACLPVDKVAGMLGYVPADDPGLVTQIEDLINSIHNELGD